MTNGNSKQESVIIAGEDVSDKSGHGSGDPGSGIFIIIAGSILLLNSIGYLPWQIWNYIWIFWPLILVFMGMNIILGNGKTAKIVMAVFTGVCFALVVIYAGVQVRPDFRNWLPDQLKGVIEQIEAFQGKMI